jgi:hypothetical protein
MRITVFNVIPSLYLHHLYYQRTTMNSHIYFSVLHILHIAEAGLRSSVHFRTYLYVPYPACWVHHYSRSVERTQTLQTRTRRTGVPEVLKRSPITGHGRHSGGGQVEGLVVLNWTEIPRSWFPTLEWGVQIEITPKRNHTRENIKYTGIPIKDFDAILTKPSVQSGNSGREHIIITQHHINFSWTIHRLCTRLNIP